MKKHIENLEELKEIAEQFGEDNVEENMLEEETQGMKYKPAKKKMCEELMKTGKCKAGGIGMNQLMRSPSATAKGKTTNTCKFAHNPLELDLIKPEQKIWNLKGVVTN